MTERGKFETVYREMAEAVSTATLFRTLAQLSFEFASDFDLRNSYLCRAGRQVYPLPLYWPKPEALDGTWTPPVKKAQ